TARTFAQEGAHVALWDRAEQVGQVAHGLAKEHGVRTLGIMMDVTDEEAVGAALRTTEDRLGKGDHLVHAAAIGSGKFGFPFTNLRPADWPRVLQVNVMGMVNVAHMVGPALVERRGGSMVFLSSVAGQIGSQTDPPYSASKAANINFAQCLAKDMAPHGVRVNSVCPGMVQTPLNRGVWQAWNDLQPADNKRSYEDWAGEKIKNVV